MKIARLVIKNFRGIRSSTLILPDHGVFIGDNNTGKSTVLEAIDLVLGPDRLSRRPPVDEHDFYQGKYYVSPPKEVEGTDVTAKPAVDVQKDAPAEAAPAETAETESPRIEIEALVTKLSDEQRAHFWDYIEWWNEKKNELYETDTPAGIDTAEILPALRVTFIGHYDQEDDDFVGKTYFARSLTESEDPDEFNKKNKQRCGFLYLRALRTGSRALSLERGSLLDIILRLKEIRPQIWEDTLDVLDAYKVASDPAIGISGILESVATSLKKFVPKEWGMAPHLKVSTLTREHLRHIITAFIATGEGEHAAPFYYQGTGTKNMLVLALLSQIAEDKQNVVFAMEEPETAIPPYAQKRIIHEVRKLSAQSLFTSHSPYVLEEFELEETVVLNRTKDGVLSRTNIALPSGLKHKRYRQDFRTRFCEGLLSRRVLVCEGATEATAIPAAARRLAGLAPSTYASLEGLGVSVVDAGTETQVGPLGGFYRSLGKTVFGLCDKQDDATKAAIEAAVDELFMHGEKGLEDLVISQTTTAALENFADKLDWPSHLKAKFPTPKKNLNAALKAYFDWAKGDWGIADFLAECTEAEIPAWIRDTCKRLKAVCDPPPPPLAPAPEAGGAAPSGVFA